MTSGKRVRLSPQVRRAQLIELGVELLATRQLDELSVELIAQTAGISRGLLFHYFASKQEFHTEVARAAAAEMLRRTEPDPALVPAAALRASIDAFIGYVEENPDSYKSLVRGAASGDAEMRTIFAATRSTFARRIIANLADLGLAPTPRVEVAMHGWIAYVEECTIRWLEARTFRRDELSELLATSLPALAMSASTADIPTLVAIMSADSAPGAAGPG